MRAIDRADARHYTWGDGCDGWHLVADRKLSVIEEEMPPGASEVAHFHCRSQQFFYFLSGRALLDVAGKRVPVTAGQGIHLPSGVPHRIENASNERVHFIVISQPPSHGDRVLIADELKGGSTLSVYDKLKELSISLPEVTPPVAAYAPWVRSGNQLFLSGHIAKKDGKPWAGKLGAELSTGEGKEAARGVAIDLLGTLQAAAGDLNTIKRVVKLLVLVNSAPTFTEQHLVANGASELIAQVFGDPGAHARSAFGVAQIPFGSCVEIDLIAEVADE